MALPDSRGQFRFGDFELDVAAYQLRRRGRPVRLERHPMDLLILLVERRGTLVPHDDIVALLWSEGVFVEVEAGIHTTIGKIRKALRDSPTAPKFVETVPGKGYRFIAMVDVAPESEIATSRSGAVGAASRPRSQARRLATVDDHREADADDRAASVADGREHRVEELRHTYRWRHEALTRDLFVQSIFVAVGVWVLLVGTRNVTLQALGISTLLSFVVPAVLLYLWLHFGFALDHLIKCRAEAWRLLSDMGAPERSSMFNDGAFVDGWFLCVRQEEHAINTDFRVGSMFFFCITYLPLIALAHACVFQLLLVGARSLARAERSHGVWSVPIRLLPWLAVVVIVLSHVQFRFGGRNPNWMQPVVGALSLVAIYLLSGRF
jgi:DNA-binding winged helix-turn-helix (wHTH) protein